MSLTLPALRRRSRTTDPQEKPPAAVRAPEAAPTVKAPMRQVVRQYIVTATHVWVVYRVTPQPYYLLSPEAQQRSMDAQAERWAKLQGLWVKERTLMQPFNHRAWARNLDRRRPHPAPDHHTCDGTKALALAVLARGRPLTEQEYAAGECGCETWEANLIRQQRRIMEGAMGGKVTLRAVRVAELPASVDFRREVLTGRHSLDTRKVLAAERTVSENMAGPGFEARVCEPREVEWLLHRSFAPMAPVPEPDRLRWDSGWDTGDLHLFTDDVFHASDRFARTAQVTVFRGGQRLRYYLATLTVGLQEVFPYPDQGLEPWMPYGERALYAPRDADGVEGLPQPFAQEWSNTLRMMSREELLDQVQHDALLAENQEKQYEDVGRKPPPANARLAELAEAIHDQVASGPDVEAVRALGPYRVMVKGDTPTEALDRASALQTLYRAKPLQMELQRTGAQVALAAEAVIGAGTFPGHRKQMPLRHLTAGNPAIQTSIGDSAGPYLGYTADGRREPWCHDGWYATEAGSGRRPNLHVTFGTLGTGKSVLQDVKLLGNVRGGIKCLKNDPSNMAARLTRIPELVPVSIAFDVVNDGEPGILNPPGLIPDPDPKDYPDPDKFKAAMARAEQQRRSLVRDIAADLMQEAELYATCRRPLRIASETVQWSRFTSMWNLVHALEASSDDLWLEIAAALRDASHQPKLALLFPPEGEATDRYTLPDRLLTVITNGGVHAAPDTKPRDEWSIDELAARPLTNLGTFFTIRAGYDKPREERAAIYLDELHEWLRLAAGQAAYNRLARDHSKENICVDVASQAPTDVLTAGVREYIATVTSGYLKTREGALLAADIMEAEDREQVADTITTLPAGMFVHADVDKRIRTVRCDVDYHPEVVPYLFTNPRPEGSGAWDVEEELL